MGLCLSSSHNNSSVELLPKKDDSRGIYIDNNANEKKFVPITSPNIINDIKGNNEKKENKEDPHESRSESEDSTQLTTLKQHTVHLSQHPAYPKRATVKAVSWNIDEPDYKPIDFTHNAVFANDRTIKDGGWADPITVKSIKDDIAARGSYCGNGQIHFVDDIPRNPMGRTGMIGRGLLGKWGPNYAADPIVTRIKPGSDVMQVVVVERGDTHEWAIPGGMVEAGDTVSQTLKREFEEEAGNVPEEDRERVQKQIDELFGGDGNTVYRGYVDDPRNTDNAWMETTAVHFHCPDELGEKLELAAGDDAVKVRWLDINENDEEFKKLYSNHGSMILNARNQWKKSQKKG